VLSITQGGQVVRSPINDDFRATGRSTMGVKFVTPKAGDAVAVVTRSVETPEAVEAIVEAAEEAASEAASEAGEMSTAAGDESPDVGTDATIVGGTASSEESSEFDNGPAVDPESEG
jgi:DNA gyrase subunit A